MQNLREFRDKFGFKRKYVANFLDISDDYLSQIERGIGAMNDERANKLANLYQTTSKHIKEVWRINHELRQRNKIGIT